MKRKDGTNKQGVRQLDEAFRPVVVPLLAPDLPFPDLPAPREPIMDYFAFGHLPAGPMRETSAQFAVLAEYVHAKVPRCAERTVALRKILEGKDAAVRAAMPKR